MLPMIFKFLGGPIISKVVDTGVRYLERKHEITIAIDIFIVFYVEVTLLGIER